MFDQLRSAGRQARLLDHVEHRPWPPPTARWTLGETLEDVLFAHWRVSPEALRPLVPDDVEIDTHDGAAWVGIVALRVTALRGRGLLPVPGLSSFLQLNVRTYVRGPRRQAGRLVPQPRRVEPVRRRGRTPPFRAAVLPRAPVARRDRRLARRRVRADRRARPRLQRALPRGGRGDRPCARVAGGVPRRALLPLRDRPERQARPRRDPSRAVVAARRRGGDRAGDDRSGRAERLRRVSRRGAPGSRPLAARSPRLTRCVRFAP